MGARQETQSQCDMAALLGISSLSSLFFATIHMAAGFQFSDLGFITCIALRCRIPVIPREEMQSQRITAALLGISALSSVGIHASEGHLFTMFILFLALTILSLCPLIGTIEGSPSLDEANALLWVVFPSPSIIHMTVGSDLSSLDVFGTCIALRPCVSMGAREELQSQRVTAALIGISSLYAASLGLACRSWMPIFLARCVATTSPLSPSIRAVERMQLQHRHLCTPWDVLPTPFYYPQGSRNQLINFSGFTNLHCVEVFHYHGLR